MKANEPHRVNEEAAAQDPSASVVSTLRQDLRQKDLGKTLNQEYREAKEFLLDEHRRMRLERMGKWRMWLWATWWLFRSMILRLTPARRFVLLVGILTLLFSRTAVYQSGGLQVDIDVSFFSAACILFVLMLELKDKLIAKEELRAGHAVQEAFLPPESPVVDGWRLWLYCRSANEVGGDLVDFIRVDGRRCGIVLADVAGKGLPAALHMVKLQATIRALVSDAASLADLVGRINRIFCRDTLRNIFASLVYAEIAPGGDRITLVNAGHLPPMKVTHQGAVLLPKGGAAIGIVPETSYDHQVVPLGDSEFLCLFSDGVTEARDEAGQMFGEERLSALLGGSAHRPLEETGRLLIAELDRFIGGAATHDDLSIAMIQKTSAQTPA